MRSLASLRLTDLILHKVPAARRHDEEAPPVRLSNALIELTDPQRLYFQQRLRNALGRDAREVAEVTEVEYEVPSWTRAFLLGDDTDLVDLSQRLATSCGQFSRARATTVCCSSLPASGMASERSWWRRWS